ncbi:hypothetical protein QP162_03335 [Sphingomonas aurantiaca]
MIDNHNTAVGEFPDVMIGPLFEKQLFVFNHRYAAKTLYRLAFWL